MLLLGLSGLCSGDKRSYEFVEAFYVVLSDVSCRTSIERNRI
jgi:hypothetical protein